jgi:hypothetical protein
MENSLFFQIIAYIRESQILGFWLFGYSGLLLETLYAHFGQRAFATAAWSANRSWGKHFRPQKAD